MPVTENAVMASRAYYDTRAVAQFPLMPILYHLSGRSQADMLKMGIAQHHVTQRCGASSLRVCGLSHVLAHDFCPHGAFGSADFAHVHLHIEFYTRDVYGSLFLLYPI